MNTGISTKGMTPEWRAREGEKSNKLIRARILEASGETDTALAMYAEVAAEEEQIRDYCRSLGLVEKTYIKAVSAAGCWARAGDLHRALQQYDALINDPTLTPKMRNRVCEIAEKLREQRRKWAVLRLQEEYAAEYGSEETSRPAETVAAA